MVKTKVISVANQKGGVGKSTSVYCIGAGLVAAGHKALLVDVDPQGDLTKMLGQRKPHALSLTLANKMNDIVAGMDAPVHPEVMHHAESFDFVPANRTLSAVKTGQQAVKSAQAAAKTAQKTAQAAKVAAQKAAKAAKRTAQATARAVRAILAGIKALIAALIAGG